MAEYKDIHGTAVRNSAGNLAGAKTGELFYDTTSTDFKYQFPNVTSAGAWRTGNSLNTARTNLGFAGIQTAALGYGGSIPSATKDETELYNGTSWTELADLNTGKSSVGSAGTSTSALSFGGSGAASTNESWNGSGWTEV